MNAQQKKRLKKISGMSRDMTIIEAMDVLRANSDANGGSDNP